MGYAMSADNAILVLEFPDGSCKVKHTLNLIEISPNDDFVNWKMLYKEFEKVEFLPSKEVAEVSAIGLLQEYWYVEYGIVHLPLKLNWNDIQDKVKGKNK